MLPQNKPLRVHTHCGIGDLSWVYSKLVTLNRPLDIIYYVGEHAATEPIGNRCTQLLQMLPHVRSFRVSTLVSKLLRGHNPAAKSDIDKAEEIHCVVNQFIEAGNRIEQFIPDLDIQHHYELNIPAEDVRYAEMLTKNTPDYVLLYASCVSTNANWGGWGPDQWAALIYHYRMLIANKPVILIGSEWDKDLANQLQIPWMVNLIGQTSLGTTLELIRRSTHFLSFPSGLAILACQLNKPVMMLYPRELRGLMYSWAPMDMIADHSYIPVLWTHPQQVAEELARYWTMSGVILRNIKVTTSCRPITIS